MRHLVPHDGANGTEVLRRGVCWREEGLLHHACGHVQGIAGIVVPVVISNLLLGHEALSY